MFWPWVSFAALRMPPPHRTPAYECRTDSSRLFVGFVTFFKLKTCTSKVFFKGFHGISPLMLSLLSSAGSISESFVGLRIRRQVTLIVLFLPAGGSRAVLQRSHPAGSGLFFFRYSSAYLLKPTVNIFQSRCSCDAYVLFVPVVLEV